MNSSIKIEIKLKVFQNFGINSIFLSHTLLTNSKTPETYTPPK
jgi:hypothetical protein